MFRPDPRAGSQQHWRKTVAAAERERKVVVFGLAGEILPTALIDSLKNLYPG
jgi:hypothetical protein